MGQAVSVLLAAALYLSAAQPAQAQSVRSQRGRQTSKAAKVTVQTSPAGRSFTVDNASYSSAQVFSWVPGSQHTILTSECQAEGQPTRFVFAGWSDGGAVSHTVSATANAVYTATFAPEYVLTTSAGPGGTVTSSPGYHRAGGRVTIQATPDDGYDFAGWSGTGSGSYSGIDNPAWVTMGGPITQSASFAAVGSSGGGGGSSSLWISPTEIMALPMSGAAWNNVLARANTTCGAPDLANQDDPTNVTVLAKALVFARTGVGSYRDGVVSALTAIVRSGTYSGRALALGRELGSYVVSADIIDLKTFDPALDAAFRDKIRQLLRTPTTSGPANLVDCHEDRPNNWGTHCGATRIAIDLYLGDTADLARAAQVFKGWVGDRSSYAGFTYGDLSWQSNPSAPVGINPTGATIDGHDVDGVLPDDQRRAGSFTWPPPQENYTYEALQGALVQAVLLQRAGYDALNWENQALRRAFAWLHDVDNFPAVGDDAWQSHLVNYYYGTSFPAPVPASPGKSYGWTDWTHQR